MEKTNTCPKCGYVSGTAFDECMKCGVVASKFLKRQRRVSSPVSRGIESSTVKAGGTSVGLVSYVLKGWLWPVPLVLVQIWVLFTSEAIWTTKVAYVSKYTIKHGIAANHTIAGLVVITLLYWLTYTPLLSALSDRFGSGVSTSEAMMKCIVGLVRVLLFLLLCFTTYRTFVNFA